jgi:hypothetical protein
MTLVDPSAGSFREDLGGRAAASNESPFKPDFPLIDAGRSFEVFNGFVVQENSPTTLYF